MSWSSSGVIGGSYLTASYFRPRPNRAALRRPEELVPIRIEIEHENHRLREAFVWNLNGICLVFFDFDSSGHNS